MYVKFEKFLGLRKGLKAKMDIPVKPASGKG